MTRLSILKGLLAALLVVMLVGCRSGGAPTPAFNYTPPASSTDATLLTPQPTSTQVVAYVNGQPISLEAFNREVARFEAGQVALGFEVADEAAYRQQILDLLIEQELIRQQAAQQGISVSNAEVEDVINAMIAETGQEYFNGWLQTNYYTLEEFREVIRLDLLTNRLLEPVVNAVPTTAEHVHARHILVNSETEAQAVLTRLQNGEDFAALAAQFSVDVTTRDNGGDLGWFPRGGLLVPEVEEAAFNLQPGAVSGVIRSAWGYHIVQTLEFDPNREIEYETRQRLIEKAIEEWRQNLRTGADIQVVSG